MISKAPLWMIGLAVGITATLAGLFSTDWQSLNNSQAAKDWQNWWRKPKACCLEQHQFKNRHANSCYEDFELIRKMHRFGMCPRAQATLCQKARMQSQKGE